MNGLEQHIRFKHYEGALSYVFNTFAITQAKRMAPFVADPDYEVVIHIRNDGMNGMFVSTKAKLRKDQDNEKAF